METIRKGSDESQSPAFASVYLDQLKQMFPEAVREDGVDLDVLGELVGAPSSKSDERYGLNWHGKRRARQIALTPSTGTLRPAPEDSVDWDTTRHVMIEGDNLEVLKLLQKSYSGKIGLIYLDPPYNTGKEFVYPDAFGESVARYLEYTGQRGGEGERLSSNTEASGRFHTDWLSMMYPRLKLARNLLSPEGLICISIDDHEHHTLRMLCDEVFGEECFVGNLTWFTTTQPDNIGRARFDVQQNIEYVLMYSKCARLDRPPFKLESKDTEKKYPHQGKFGPCRFQIIERAFEGAYARPTMRFKILGQEPRPGKQWQIGETQARELEKLGRVEVVDGVVKKAIYPEDKSADSQSYEPFWANMKQVGTSQRGKAELTTLLGQGHGVDTVKPVSLLEKLLSHLPENCTVLDFFAGSGTTAQAVYEMNAQDGGSRRVIVVQLPLPLSEEHSSQRSSAEYCDSIGKPPTLSEITKERMRRAGSLARDKAQDGNRDFGFRVFKLDSSNIQEWDGDPAKLEETLFDAINHVRPGRSESDILYEVLLKFGLDLCLPIDTEAIGDYTVYGIGHGTLFVCLPESIDVKGAEALASGIVAWRDKLKTAGDSTAIFRDSAFKDDVAKSNLTAILQQHGIKNVRSL